MIYYFIYKPINITGIGGVSIPTITGIDGGHGQYGDWLLGTMDNPVKLALIKEFQPRLVDEAVWRGLLLIGLTSIVDNTTIPPSSMPLNATELSWQKAAINWQTKENTRHQMHLQVGDTEDQIADIDKQLQLITPMAVRVYLALMHVINSLPNGATLLSDLNTSGVLPTALIPSYDNFANSYVNAIQAGTYRDRIDVADPSIAIPKILSRNTTKAGIAQAYQNSLVK